MTGGFDNTKENEQARRLQAKLDLASAITYAESLGKVVDEQKAENEALRGERDALVKEMVAAADLTGCKVVCREGGGPENVAGTLALSVAKLLSYRNETEQQLQSWVERYNAETDRVDTLQAELSAARQVVEAAGATMHSCSTFPPTVKGHVIDLLKSLASRLSAPPRLSDLPADERLAASVAAVVEAATPPSREVEGFECYATFRKREGENDGREFFFHALWHNEITVSPGERVVKGRFVPDDEQPASVCSKSELEDRAFALELREVELRRALEFYADPKTYSIYDANFPGKTFSRPIDNEMGERARIALAAPTGEKAGGGE